MTSLHSAYTPLESLLLFQALRSEGVHAISFNRISEQLKSIPLVQNDPSYDSGRLSPDALRELYLGLLKDEVKRDLEQQSNGDTQHAPVNGDVSRKRKAPSPSLPTVHEAAQHNHLIPQLVSRLYARYRDNVVKRLREHERKHDASARDLAEIEAGEWDERLQRLRVVPARQSPRPSSTAHSQPVAPHPESTKPPPSAGGDFGQPNRFPQAALDPVNGNGSDRPSSPDDPRMVSTSTALPPTSDTTLDSPRLGASMSPGNVPGPQSQHVALRQPSPPRTVLPPPPPPPPPTLPAVNIVQPQPMQQATSTGTQTTNVLPHHPTPAQNQAQAVPSHADTHHHPGRLPSQAHPGPDLSDQQRKQQSPSQAQIQPQSQTQPHTPYADHRPPYQPLPPQTPSHPSKPLQASGHLLAPFQVTPQEPTKLQHQTPLQRQPLPPGVDHRLPRHMQLLQGVPATAPRLQTQAPSPMLSSILRGLATPPRLKIAPLWKSEHRPPYLNVSTEPARPEVEPHSPTHDRQRSPARSTRSTRSRDPRAGDDSSQQGPSVKAPSGRRRTKTRAGSPHSIVSSTADEPLRARTRSQSVSTVAGAMLASDEHQGGGTVKAEPSTPANLMEDAESTPAPAATPASGPRTRKRKGTLQAHAGPPSKRRLQDSPGGPENDQDVISSPPRRNNTVVAAKNFAKMCAAVMNDINSHKHASYFATAVRDKDAPGYSEIVFQPQNLKSIRAAITAGTRAVNAAASTLDSPTGTPVASTSKMFEGSSAVELERTVDLIPPKAIVNGAQLEKELMRMFANAYMFNPGEDGMALITREMFQDVEQTLNDWRGTEREAGGDEDEEGKGKRRKL